VSLDALYPKPLLRLAASAHGAGRLPHPTATAIRVNPLCGDRITLDLEISDERIAAIGYEVKACVLCQAAASAVAQILPGQARAEAASLRAVLKAMLSEGSQAPAGFDDFQPVRPYPSRHACVLLPLDAVIEALERS
jgi:nitrogen fixation NifU-like protein